jgi:uncharacterized membrane protein YozB (DUF420 family)
MHVLWYVLPVTVVSLVVIFIVLGLRYLYKGKSPPLWLQFACIVPFMLFSFRYWYLPIDIAAGMFSGIFDPFHNMFPGMAAKDTIPCTNVAYPCSVLSFDYPKHVAWTIGLFDGYTLHAWVPKVLKVHILFNAVALCLFPWQLWLMQHGKRQQHRVVGRIIGISVVLGTSLGWFISIRSHSQIQAYGGVLSIVAFGIVWASIVGSATLGYIFIKKKDIENHKKWMVRCFGALFGSFFFWRIEALVLQWMFSSANGWLFYTLNTWLLGMLLFDYAARKSGFYAAQTPQLDTALS